MVWFPTSFHCKYCVATTSQYYPLQHPCCEVSPREVMVTHAHMTTRGVLLTSLTPLNLEERAETQTVVSKPVKVEQTDLTMLLRTHHLHSVRTQTQYSCLQTQNMKPPQIHTRCHQPLP